MGILYVQQKEYDKALAELEKARVSKNDTDAKFMLYVSLGDVYSELERYDEAINAFRNALKYDPEGVSTKADIAFCYAMREKYDEALKIFREILSANSKYMNAYLGIARCYIEMKMFNEAIDYLQQAITLEPQSPMLHKMLAEANLGLGANDVALKEAHLALNLNPSQEVSEGAQEIIDIIEGNLAPLKDGQSSCDAMDMLKEPAQQNFLDGSGSDQVQADVSGEAQKMLYCTNPSCKKAIPDDSVFCGYCGTKVSGI